MLNLSFKNKAMLRIGPLTDVAQDLRIFRELLPANSSACASEECKMRNACLWLTAGAWLSNLVNRSRRNQKSCLLLAGSVPSGASNFPAEKSEGKIAFCQMSKQKQQWNFTSRHSPPYFLFFSFKSLFADLTQWDGIFARTKDAVLRTKFTFYKYVGHKSKRSVLSGLTHLLVMGLCPGCCVQGRWCQLRWCTASILQINIGALEQKSGFTYN